MKKHLKDFQLLAINAAEKAARLQMKYYQKKFEIKTKEGGSLVTEIDLQSEEIIIKTLSKASHHFGFLAEESGVTHRLQNSNLEGRWIIDPIDGTTNFAHGFPIFCISIALEINGVIQLGVIHHPPLNEVYTSIRGQGAFMNKKRMQVSPTRMLGKSVLSTGFTYRQDKWLHLELQAFEQISRLARAVRRPGSAALDLAYTARGVFDGFWERNLAPWDIAAGLLLVQEAGGKVTDFHGTPIRFNQPETLACNRHLHRQMVDALTNENRLWKS